MARRTPAAPAPETASETATESEATAVAKKPRKPRVVKERKPISLDKIVARTVQDRTEMAKARPLRIKRDDQQRAVDAIVESAYAKWVEAGRPDPSKWVDLAGSAIKLEVPSDEVDTVQWMIRKGGLYYAVKIRFGDVRRHDDYAEFVFVATDRKADEANEESDEDSDQESDESDEPKADEQ